MKLPSNEQWLYLFNTLVSRWVNSGKVAEKYTPATILCVKLDEIGDMASCTHVFSLLKKRFPKSTLHVLTKPYCEALIASDPSVDGVYSNVAEWDKKYDLLIELRGTRQTLWRTFRYYPKLRFDRGTIRFKNKGKQPHETLTNFQIVEPVLAGIPFERPRIYPSNADKSSIDSYLLKNKITKYAVIHPGARRALRKWTDQGFASLADWLSETKGMHIIFAGIPEEEAQIKNITDKMKSPFSMFTKGFSLLELAALLEKANLFVGNESGPLQIADVMNTRLVGLFGPGVKTVFYPQNPHSAIVHYVLECNPCDQIHCVHPENSCMNRITIEEVKAAVEKVLDA